MHARSTSGSHEVYERHLVVLLDEISSSWIPEKQRQLYKSRQFVSHTSDIHAWNEFTAKPQRSFLNSPCGFFSGMSRGLATKLESLPFGWRCQSFPAYTMKLADHLFRGYRHSRACPSGGENRNMVLPHCLGASATHKFASHGSRIHVSVEDAELVGDVLPDRERRAILPA